MYLIIKNINFIRVVLLILSYSKLLILYLQHTMVQNKSFQWLFCFSNKIDNISYSILFYSAWWWVVNSAL